jgi:hypothetical protein
MNTLNLARQYDQLTARERFALLLAAAAREDEFELSRLLLSAPRKHYAISDHHGLVQSFGWLSDYHFTALLDLARYQGTLMTTTRRTFTVTGPEGPAADPL